MSLRALQGSEDAALARGACGRHPARMPKILAVFALLTLLGTVALGKESAGDNLLENGSFEASVAGRVPKDAGQGLWKLAGSGRMATGWSLNAGYPGVFSLVEGDAADGNAHVRIEAGVKRDAQVFRPCPAMQSGVWYRISARVRGGTATLLTYEYGPKPAPQAFTLASITAPKGEWRTMTGFYAPARSKFRSAAVTLLVPKGGTADFDDVRVVALDGPVAEENARSIRLRNGQAELVLSGAGQLESLIVQGSAVNRAAELQTAPVLVATRDGVRMPVSTLTKKGSTLVARFPDAAISVKLKVKAEKRYFSFEVAAAKPKDLEALVLRFPTRPLKVRDAWMPGTYDDAVGIAHMGTSATTITRLARHAGSVVPEATWRASPGIRGGRSALVATQAKHFLPTIRQMALDTGLPAPVLRSSHAAGTVTMDWARVSPATKASYLFATYLGFGHIDKLIQYAQEGGFGLIMLHRKSWRASAGHEEIARTAFPDGLPTLAAVCKRIHAAGLGVGLHLYGPAVSTNDAYVTPVPDKRLFSYPVGKLAAQASADATEFVLRERPALPARPAPDLHPGNLLRLGDEIVRWKRIAPGTPVRLTGCERGALGTKPAAHRKGATVRTLVMRHGGLLVDPDSSLPKEMGAHLARVVNACEIDLVYFDACAAAAPHHQPENWYYLNKVLLASCGQFDHGVMIQWGMGPGRQLAWHLIPRSASADGHGDLKRYLDQRMAGIRQMRKTHTAADIGWYALDIHGRPDELEYVCAKALAVGGSISVQAHKPLLESHPRAREVFDTIARWERLRRSDAVPANVRALIAKPGRDVRALDTQDGTSLWEAVYDGERAVTRIDGKANMWSLTNDRKVPVALGVEIERVPVASTPADHAAKTAIRVDDLGAADGFVLRGDGELGKHILFGGRALAADGFARRGVALTLKGVKDPAVGGRALRVRGANATRAAGWCAAGKTFAEPLDLSAARSLGLWVHGDGVGATLTVVLVDAAGVRARHGVTLDYRGWRFQSFEPGGPRAFDWSKVAHLIVELGHMPPLATVTARVAALRAMPTRHEPGPIPSVTVVVGRREVDLNVALEPGRVITIDPLGQGVYWPGGMRPGSPSPIAGGPLLLAPGTHKVGVSLKDPSRYAGSLRVRFHRAWPLGR